MLSPASSRPRRPHEHRERDRLEWLGELDASPGKLLKLVFAARIALRVPATSRELEGLEPLWIRLARWLLGRTIAVARALARLASHWRSRTTTQRKAAATPPSADALGLGRSLDQQLPVLGDEAALQSILDRRAFEDTSFRDWKTRPAHIKALVIMLEEPPRATELDREAAARYAELARVAHLRQRAAEHS